jgi:hypothetical protein
MTLRPNSACGVALSAVITLDTLGMIEKEQNMQAASRLSGWCQGGHGCRGVRSGWVYVNVLA